MILTFKKSESLGDIYLLTLSRTIEYKINSVDAEPIDIINFLEIHYKGKYTECENLEYQEIDEKKLGQYIAAMEENAKESVDVDINSSYRYSMSHADDNFYTDKELINILLKLDEEEEKAFIPSLKLHLSDKKNLTYHVDY